ncbi:hypothetical protein QTP86_018017, partial [Hemibagrus guttatus]
TNFIPDRSRPGLTTTAIGAVDLQGAGGNWATVGRRSKGGRRVRRQREKRKGKSVGLRIGTLNVGTMTGKGRELADVMERRKVDILCVQETRWKGSKARSIGAGFKLFYYGVDSKRNGVGVVLKEEFVRNVLEVKRVSDRVMSLKLEIEGVMLNVVSGYAPQVGCELEEKERFWSELDEVMESIPTGERVVIGADFNGHVGEGNTGDEEVMGKFGVKERNLEGQMVVDFAKRMDMGVVNTYFQKREEHRVTYKSGGRSTQVDYILCRRGNLKEISDCKVVVGESVARQHRMVVCRMTLMVCKKKRSEIEKKTKWWKLKKEECCEEFRQKLRQALGGQAVLPDDWETTAEVIRETGRKVLGVSSGRRKEDKETWWWNEEVQDSIQRKRLAKKKWDMDRTEENRQEYKELQRRVKREVSKAKQKAYDELYTRLDTREGEKDLYRLARQRDRDGKDVQQVRVIKDRDGRVLTSEESVQRRWKEYFEELMNEENEREKRVEGVNSVEQKVDKIRKDEVRKALKRMKSGKAVGPDDIPVEVWKCLGEAAVEFLASLFNRVLESERMPEEWRRSVLVPIFKNKGDVQSCSNYRGIKLMSHTMKLWERVVEARLRKVVEICEQQYGFMPRKSTTDAIFALRILMEKYRDGQRELHCVFVDLEKAYDRVPREELWYCMRKSGVAEKYVRVVQDMYERSRTVVRCAVGQTEEFNVEVGLHQGSALSPFLFAIVMDQLSEEVRQESPWTMMFADDIVICSESREQVEENLERWRFALERRGMKVSRSKTEYMCVNEREGSGTVRLQGEEVKKVQEFKYLGSTVQSNGECGKEVKKRVQAGWNGWRKVSGVLCDQKISARIKGKVYRTVVRPAMLYGLETVSLKKRQESELEVAELKMLRFSLGVTRLDRIRNEYIRGTAHVGHLGNKVREARLRWFGHVQRRESTALLPVVAFPFEDFYIDTHHVVHHLEPRIQHILFYTGLLAAACGIGGIRAILCPLGVNNLQGYNQKKILSFFNWIYWLVNLNSTVIFLGIAYIQQSVGKNLGFFIPFTSVLLGLIGMHMARSDLILHPRKGGSLLTTVGVFLNSLQMCCLRYRHLSGDVTDWLDRAKENNGGCYSETKVENVKILVKLFPLFGLQLLYRACITQIPSGYYLQTMHSNLNLNGVMLPIAAMNVISILPLLILAPLLEFVSICYQYSKKTPPSPVKFIIIGHACTALSALIAGITEIHRKHYPQMDETISGTVLRVSSMPCVHLAPQYILLGVAEAFVTPACSVISFCLTPSNLRGIALQVLTLSYGGGCFLGALLIQFFYFVSGGSFYPNILNNGNMDRFFLILATLMAINTLILWKISNRYTDLSALNTRVRQSRLAEKLLQYKACLRYYTVEPHQP